MFLLNDRLIRDLLKRTAKKKPGHKGSLKRDSRQHSLSLSLFVPWLITSTKTELTGPLFVSPSNLCMNLHKYTRSVKIYLSAVVFLTADDVHHPVTGERPRGDMTRSKMSSLAG